MTPRTPTTAAGRRAEADWNTLADSGDVYAWQDGTDISVHITGHILAIEAEARAPLDVERLAHGVMAGVRLRLLGGNTDQSYTPTEVAVMVHEVIEQQYAALEEPTDD